MHSPTTSPYGYSSFPKEEIGDTSDFLVNLLFIRGNEIASIKQTQRLSFQSILAFVV